MKAREIKIANMQKQLNFIQQQLDKIPSNENGDPSYTHTGDIFLEVYTFFVGEGWTIINTQKTFKGMPIYRFTCAYTELTDSELEEAKNFQYPDTSKSGGDWQWP